MRLNLGCGRDVRDGWVNIDCTPGPGVDHVIDFDSEPGLGLCGAPGSMLPFPDDSVEHSEASHLIEHLRNPLPFMQELWRVTRPGGTVELLCPHGSSDEADEDPTHVRRMYEGSWRYFSQPFYWRADYGYRGDWQPEEVKLLLHPGAGRTDDEAAVMVRHQRNTVAEMRATLIAVKPARPARQDMQQPYPVTLIRQAGDHAARLPARHRPAPVPRRLRDRRSPRS